jgi:energy-coupling factor transporter transmembrane protein EcfT
MPIFQYQAINSPIHKTHAFAKFSILIVVSLLGSFILDPRYKIPLLILVLIYARISKLPLKEYKGLFLLVGISLLLVSLYSVFFIVDENLFKVIDPEWAGTVIFQITDADFPIFGEAALTYGGLVWMANRVLSGLLVITLLANHVNTTSLNETVQALSSLKAPFPVTYITMVAMRFTPELAGQFTLVHRAQSLRGWQVKTRNPVKIVRLYAPLLLPVIRYVIKSIDITTMSTQNRAFGLGPVTNMSEGQISTTDKAIIISAWVILIVMLVLIFGFNIGNL